MEYNNNLATQQTPQPRVSYQPGHHQQQPTAPSDPPVTQSMSAWAASVSPLVTGDNGLHTNKNNKEGETDS